MNFRIVIRAAKKTKTEKRSLYKLNIALKAEI